MLTLGILVRDGLAVGSAGDLRLALLGALGVLLLALSVRLGEGVLESLLHSEYSCVVL